ncbi:hypothetical protein LP414_27640 [Polaromonas sp. P1(28)-13]|nr:hypothetical protein LP414_27640 [Polaromonas sp. P1(28)-13]
MSGPSIPYSAYSDMCMELGKETEDYLDQESWAGLPDLYRARHIGLQRYQIREMEVNRERGAAWGTW